MNFIIAEAISHEPIENSTGDKLFCARALKPSSPKHAAISEIFERAPVSYFMKAGRYLAHYLKIKHPLVFVTDWTDPTELIGLRLETNGATTDYPNLCFLAFYTNWDNISASGIEDIFAHEFSHMWMTWLGMDYSLSMSNKFHCSTATTDFYLAFSEGFAEWLEIVTKDLSGYVPADGELWDYAFDGNAQLSARERQLRYHAVKNNRFIYQTATPYPEDFNTYTNLHMAHITSSAFTPEKLRNASQMLSCEGAVASVFYQIYAHEMFKNRYEGEEFYAAFGADLHNLDTTCNLLIKMVYAMSKIDLKKPSLMTDFIRSYGECFPDEKAELYNVFTKTTHFVTASHTARDLFGEIYRIGRRGVTEEIVHIIRNIRNPLVADLREKLLNGQIPLDAATYKEIWIIGDEEIAPTPWEPDEKVPYRFNINTATAIDFMALNGITLNLGEQLVIAREKQYGFDSIDEFMQTKDALNKTKS